MSLTTIPITIYLSFDQPAGVTITPQIVAGLGDRSVVFNPRTSNDHDAAQVAPRPEIAHASVETGATDAHSDTTAALIERLRAENRRLEDEAVLLRDALIRLSADSMDFNPLSTHHNEIPAMETNGHARVRTNATDPPDCIPGYRPRTSRNGETSPAERNGHASVETGATADRDDEPEVDIDDDFVAPDVTASDAPEIPLSPRHHKALYMLVGGSTIAQIARELKVNSSTVGRWMRKPHFVARYNRHMRECDHAIHRKLQTICDDAVEVMAAHVNLGSLRAAVHVLKGRGFLGGQKNKLVPILEADPVAADTPEPAPEPAPHPPFPQRESLNGHAVVGLRPEA